MDNWLLGFSAKRAMDIEERLNKDPQFIPIKNRLETLKQNLITPECFRLIKEIEGLEDAVTGIIKDEFYLQGIRDGLKLAQEKEGMAFPEYYREMTQVG